jgi:hypothetical protein
MLIKYMLLTNNIYGILANVKIHTRIDSIDGAEKLLWEMKIVAVKKPNGGVF